MVWSVLGAAGVWDSINQTVQDVVGGRTPPATSTSQNYLGMSRVLGFTMLVAVIDVILLTAIATLGASSTTWPPPCSAASRSPSRRTSAEPRGTRTGVDAVLSRPSTRGVVSPSVARSTARRSRGDSGPIAQTVRALP